MGTIYTIPPNHSFFNSLVVTLLDRYGSNQLQLSRSLILLPCRRACRKLQETFLLYNQGKATLLPKIIPLGDIDEEELNVSFLSPNDASSANVPTPIDALEQRILLATMIHEYKYKACVSSIPAATELAIELASFLTDAQRSQIDLSKLAELVTENMAIHWQEIMNFLQIIISRWPALLEQRNLVDPTTYQNLIIDQYGSYWTKNPPDYPIIVAGVTGNTLATSRLLKTIFNLQNSMIILPALDLALDDISWQEIDATHPQYNLKNLLNYLSIARRQVSPLAIGTPSSPAANLKLLAEIMRPAAATDKWQNLNLANFEGFSLDHINYVVCATMEEEASVIALILRQAMSIPGKTAAFVTNDRELAKRVISSLRKWQIIVDDAAGIALSNTTPAIFFRLVAETVASSFHPISLLSLLKHSLCLCGYDKSELEQIMHRIETLILRENRSINDLANLKKAALACEDVNIISLIEQLEEWALKLTTLLNKEESDIADILTEHIRLCEKLATNNYNIEKLWAGEMGEQLSDFLNNLLTSAQNFGQIESFCYPKLLDTLFLGQVFRPINQTHPRLAILSPVEARFHNYDLIVMGGLNEGSWPRFQSTGPWISRKMREELGLPFLEQKIGQAAHDFSCLFCSKEVVLTRAQKVHGTATVPSRWLLRLETVLSKLFKKNFVLSGKEWRDWARQLYTPEFSIQIPPPSPRPSLHLRPRKLSVTGVEKLIRNPYTIYAAHILKIKPLQKISLELKPSDFGIFVHKALEFFSGENNNLSLLECGKKALGDLINMPVVQNLWWPRFERIASWILKREHDKATKIYSEISGEIQFATKSGPFILTAKADRIEVDQENNIEIIDYKTGSIPSLKDIRVAIAPQMTLEALIALKKGFPLQLTTTTHKIAKLIYIQLSGGEHAGSYTEIKEEIDQLIEEAELGLKDLIDAFSDQNTPYLCCPVPSYAPKYDEYQHLSRSKEWVS